MNRRTMIISGGTIVAVAIGIAAIFSLVTALQQKEKSVGDGAGQQASSSQSLSSAPTLQNAFSSDSASEGISASQGGSTASPGKITPPSPPIATAPSSSASSGSGAAPALATTTTTAVLAIPTVPDSEITIDPSGVATVLAFLESFNAPTSGIVFDNAKFNSALKDKNGIVLFVPDLVNKALTDNNFAEVHDSLLVQNDFAAAEIKYLRSMKVTGSAIAVDKEVIGVEELTEELIGKALAVNSGNLSVSDFSQFNNQFMATVSDAHNNLIAQLGGLSLIREEGWLTRFLKEISAVANAQAAGIPFGGPVTITIPCDGGMLVTVGPPVPTTIFVSVAFMATPLFFLYRALHTGAFWLGLYEPVPIPCIVGLVPIGAGFNVIMAGTSE